MGLLSIASYASQWRGYEYYEEKKVLSCVRINGHEYSGDVSGSAEEVYHVVIDIDHPKKSVCNCPFAEGTRKVCKHKVALFFAAFPEEADKYIAEIEEYEREEEQREQGRYDELENYVNSLSTAELRLALLNALSEADEKDRYH